MAYDGTVFTAIKLDDKDVNDPNSGFYTAQATTNQINSIPTDAKAEGELLYNKTTGKLVVLNGVAGAWETLNSSEGFNGNVVINSYPTAPISPVEGEVYYNTTTNTYQVYTDGEWQDITTSATEIIAQSHTTDPETEVEGLIYYNTTDHALRSYSNLGWAYVSPKPYILMDCSAPGLSFGLGTSPAEILDLSGSDIVDGFLFSRASNYIVFNGHQALH